MAESVSLNAKLQHAKREAEAQALTDGLTGLLNRRAIMSQLEQELARHEMAADECRRQSQDLAAINRVVVAVTGTVSVLAGATSLQGSAVGAAALAIIKERRVLNTRTMADHAAMTRYSHMDIQADGTWMKMIR